MVDTVYVARHGFRMAITHFNTANQLPRDPPLTAHGEGQARKMADFFASLPRNEQPQLVISSPFSRCITTAMPTVERLDLELVVEPGLAEWFPPVWPTDTGVHPSPPRAEQVQDYFPRVSTRWSPLMYPDPEGETIADVHHRMYACFERLNRRCEEWGIRRVLLVSHAASSIALGRMLLTAGQVEHAKHDIRAGTASVSKYAHENGQWKQEYNGNTSFLPGGSEREWDFGYVPENNTEPGMGVGWTDRYEPKDTSLIYRARSRL